MRQMANDTHAALMRHIPAVAGECIRSRDRRVYNAAFHLMLSYRRMRRAEAKRRRKEDTEKR